MLGNAINIENENADMLLDDIMEEFGTDLTILAFSYVKDIEASKDIVQTVFLKCFLHIKGFEKRSSLKTWLYRITVNQCKDYLKSYYIRKIFLTDDTKERATKQTPETITLRKLNNQGIIDHIMRLPKKYREVLILRFIHELKSKEIAEILSVPLDTVKTRIRRAKDKLRPTLKEEYFNEE
jgi:RNA polymerase sigma-70 factor, ECF subfamily